MRRIAIAALTVLFTLLVVLSIHRQCANCEVEGFCTVAALYQEAFAEQAMQKIALEKGVRYSADTTFFTSSNALLVLRFDDASLLVLDAESRVRFVSARGIEQKPHLLCYKFELLSGKMLFIPSPIGSRAEVQIEGVTISSKNRFEAFREGKTGGVYSPNGGVEVESKGELAEIDADLYATIGEHGVKISRTPPVPLKERLSPRKRGLKMPLSIMPPTIKIRARYEDGSYILDSSASYDSDAEPILRWWWEPVAGKIYGIKSLTTSKLVFRAFDGEVKIRAYIDNGATHAFLTYSLTARNPEVNNAPRVRITGTALTTVGRGVSLSATTSDDPDGDRISYLWKVTPQTGVTTEKSDEDTFFIKPNTAGEYTVSLTITDIYGAVSTNSIRFRAVNQNNKPVAVATLPKRVSVGEPFMLDSSTSTDPEGEPLSAYWALLESPDPLAAASIPRLGERTVRLFTPGMYLFNLIVSDGDEISEPTQTQLEVMPSDGKPMLRVDTKGSVVGDDIIVDITGSFDDTQEALKLTLRFVSGPFCGIRFTDAGRAEFTASSPGTYRFYAKAENNRGFADKTIEIPVFRRNSPPSARMQGTKRCSVGDEAVFEPIAAFDPDDDPLTFHWSAESIATGAKTEAIGPRFVFKPQTEGSYVIRMYVSDGIARTDAPIQELSVLAALAKPTVRAVYSPKPAYAHSKVTLSGAASSPSQGGVLSFQWFQVDGPPVELEGGGIVCWFVPRYSGIYTFLLKVDESGALTNTAVIEVQVKQGNMPPTPAAPSKIVIRQGESFTLQGSLSFDLDGDKITGEWEHVNGDKLWKGEPDFSKTDVSLRAENKGTARFKLTVSDGQAKTVSETEVICVNRDAKLIAVEPQVITTGINSTVTLKVVNPIEGGVYKWTQHRGVTLMTEITAPTLDVTFPFSGVFEFCVNATVKSVAMQPVYATVIVRPTQGVPVVSCFAPSKASVNRKVTLAAATEGKNAGAEYIWRQLSGPVAQLSSSRATQETVTFFPKEPGIYEFEVVAIVAGIRSAPARAKFEVTSPFPAPVANAGADFYCEVGATLTLDGSGSRQAGGGSLTYLWKQVGGPAIVDIEKQTESKVNLVPLKVGNYSFELEVSNGQQSSSDLVEVRVKEPNRPPEVRVEAPYEIVLGDMLIVDLSSTVDGDGDSLRYALRRTGGQSSKASFRFLPYFVIENLPLGSHEFEASADDGFSGISRSRFIVRVVPRERRGIEAPLLVQTSEPTDIVEIVSLVSTVCEMDILVTKELLDTYKKDGAFEKRIAPQNWVGSRSSILSYLAYELSAFYRDPIALERRYGAGVVKVKSQFSVQLSRGYGFLSEESADVHVYSYPGAVTDDQVEQAIVFLREFMAPADGKHGFSIAKRDMNVVANMPMSGQIRLKKLIDAASAPRPAMPKPWLTTGILAPIPYELIYVPESVVTLGELVRVVSTQSQTSFSVDPQLAKAAVRVTLPDRLRASLTGWISLSGLMDILVAEYPWFVWLADEYDEYVLTITERQLIERSSENIWDCGTTVVFVPIRIAGTGLNNSIIETIKKASPILDALWKPHDGAVFMGTDPRGRLVLCNSPKALSYTLSYLWRQLEIQEK